jgi:dihydropteroate synthase
MLQQRPRKVWQVGSRLIPLGDRTRIVAIINLAPDSFYAASRAADADDALRAAERALEEGADILDVGAESTRPGSHPVAIEEEQRRLLPAIHALCVHFPQTPISADTRHADTARRALDGGANIVNDVSGLADPEMADVILSSGCGAILMHTRGTFADMHRMPPLDDPLETVRSGLAQVVVRARNAGIFDEQIVLDPGFGFGKNLDENFPVLAQLSSLHALSFPLLAGVSRKSFIGHTLNDAPPEERLFGTVAAVVLAAAEGAHLVRVHDVAPIVDALRIVDKALQSAPSPTTP